MNRPARQRRSADLARRRFLKYGLGTGALAASGGLTGLLAGCGRADPEDGIEQGKPGKEFSGELSLLLGSHMAPVKTLAKNHGKKHGVDIETEDVTTPDLRKVVTKAFLARKSPWDAVFTNATLAQELASRRWVYATDSFVDESVKPRGKLMRGGLRAATYDGDLVGVPWTMGAPLMHWNKKMFRQVGLDPEAPAKWHGRQDSWDTFVEYAKELTGKRDGVQYYGFTDAWAEEHILYTWGSLLQMHGGRFLDEDRQPVFDDEAGVEATMKMYDLLNTHKVVDPAVSTYAWVFDASPGFLNGTRGMFFTWPFVAGLASDEKESKIVGQNGFAPQPAVDTSASVDGSEYLAVPTFGANEDEAWRFLEVVTSPRGQKEIALTGWASIYSDVNRDPEVLRKFPVYEAVVQSYEYPVDGGYSPGREDWGAMLGNEISEVLADKKKAKSALTDAARTIRRQRKS